MYVLLLETQEILNNFLNIAIGISCAVTLTKSHDNGALWIQLYPHNLSHKFLEFFVQVNDG